MSASLIVHRVGPAMSVQDLGRPGYMGDGLSTGGAADRLAFIEGVALLGQSLDCAAIEMAAFGGDFEATSEIRIALTGAPMKASLDSEPLVWNATHLMKAGQRLTIGAAAQGVYGYLHVGGGIQAPAFLGSRATHLVSGIGGLIDSGQTFDIGNDFSPNGVSKTLTPRARFESGSIRVVPSVQTHLFSHDVLERFQQTAFKRTPRGNRQGVELTFEGRPFSTSAQLSILSEPMVAGDIQMTGEGIPFVLLPECQTTGGYPRIGTVVPADLPLVAQAATGVTLHFRFVEYDEGLATYRTPEQSLKDLTTKVRPLVRDPYEMRDLLSYQLIDGVVDASYRVD
ncbi:MAG: biotin-dependent carboxyltransferase family protein [Boseongicola sp.]|nr:biotin-dependent carboxyltransferase family protein [Boseongicola sp.]